MRIPGKSGNLAVHGLDEPGAHQQAAFTSKDRLLTHLRVALAATLDPDECSSTSKYDEWLGNTMHQLQTSTIVCVTEADTAVKTRGLAKIAASNLEVVKAIETSERYL